MTTVSRRGLLAGATTLAAGSGARGRARAQSGDGATIGWPSDVPSWDPNQRFVPDAQSIYKMVFDQPLDQDPALRLVPNVVRAWRLTDGARALEIELRDDVVFHNGDRMTAEDFRWTFLDRIRA